MSFSVNRVTLLGNLGGDPEVRYSPDGTAKATFSLATSYSVKDGEEWKEKTEWHRVVQWGKKAEKTAEFYRKGNKVYVEGRLQTRDYDKDGEKRYVTEVVAENVIGLAGRGGEAPSGDDEFRVPAGSRPPASAARPRDDGFDDLPF